MCGPMLAFLRCAFRCPVEPTMSGGDEQVIWRDAWRRPARCGRREEREIHLLGSPSEDGAGRFTIYAARRMDGRFGASGSPSVRRGRLAGSSIRGSASALALRRPAVPVRREPE
jgi:hypothetical protein